MSFNEVMNLIDRIITEGARTLTLEDLDALMVVLPKIRDELEAEAAPEEGM